METAIKSGPGKKSGSGQESRSGQERKAFDIRHVVTSFTVDGEKLIAVDDVSLYVRPGEIVGLVGESGSGKSVTMLSSLQLVSSPGKVESGEVYLEGTDNILSYGKNSPEMQKIRGGRVGIIFQEPMTSLDPVLTVGDQIAEAVLAHEKLPRREVRQRVLDLMRAVGIPDSEKRYGFYPQQFSGGMRQRVMIAIALAASPEVLIADEATTALDVTTQAQLLEMLADLSRQRGIAIIIVTHNLGIVARYASRIYVMYSGRIMEEASARELFRNPRHPYTRALLRSIPRLDYPRDHRLIPINGMPPGPGKRPPYCPFFVNCEFAREKCRSGRSELSPVKKLTSDPEDHFVSCCLTPEEFDARALELDQAGSAAAPENVPGSETVLELRHVKMGFSSGSRFSFSRKKELLVLDDVSLFVRRGETLGIVGESGCGKTTLARCVMGEYQPSEGEILFRGEKISGLSDKALRKTRASMAMIFQDPFSSLDPRQTAGSIVSESLLIHNLVRTKEELARKTEELFMLVGLDPEMTDRVPHEFSGGQRQRLGIARALASGPDLIVCDEPISALDVSIQAQIINLLEDLQTRLGISYLFIAHDLAAVKHISHRIAVMYMGNVVEITDCEELYRNPLHPYTQALLSAVPIADPEVEAGRQRIRLAGEVPSLANRPKGCPFANRCLRADERCRQEKPVLAGRREHLVTCFKSETSPEAT